jgi:hypothetical protein
MRFATLECRRVFQIAFVLAAILFSVVGMIHYYNASHFNTITTNTKSIEFARYQSEYPSNWIELSKIDNRSHWLTYSTSSVPLEFQYPRDWSITSENDMIIRITPKRNDIPLSDMIVETAIYGIRIMPLEAPYSVFPVRIQKEDIANHLKRISSFYFQNTEINYTDGSSALIIYLITANNQHSVLALKTIRNKVYQIELGRGFPRPLRTSDLLTFFSVVNSLKFH